MNWVRFGRLFFFVSLMGGVFLFSRLSRAQDRVIGVPAEQANALAPAEKTKADSPAPVPEKRVTRWYGYQTLIADGLSVGLATAALSTQTPALSSLAGAGYLFGGPAIHAAHGHWGRSFGSFGVRALLPPVGMLAGIVVGSAFYRSGGGDIESLDTIVVGGVLGALIGVAGAITIDAAVLAREKVVVTDDEARAKRPSFSYAPQFAVGKGSARVGIGGVF